MRRGRRIASGRQYAAARQHPGTCTDSNTFTGTDAQSNTFTGTDAQSNACANTYAHADTYAHSDTNADPASRQPDHFADRSKSVRDYVCVDADNLFGRQPSARRQRDGGSRRH